MSVTEQPAFNDYRNNLESEIIRLTRGKPQVKICRVAFLEDKGEHKEYKLSNYRRRGMYFQCEAYSLCCTNIYTNPLQTL
jgi:hypothetical protein